MAKLNVPKRSERRHHLDRMKAKARRVSKVSGGNFDFCYDNLAVCSCWMCGNPRRYFGQKTRREMLATEVRV